MWHPITRELTIMHTGVQKYAQNHIVDDEMNVKMKCMEYKYLVKIVQKYLRIFVKVKLQFYTDVEMGIENI